MSKKMLFERVISLSIMLLFTFTVCFSTYSTRAKTITPIEVPVVIEPIVIEPIVIEPIIIEEPKLNLAVTFDMSMKTPTNLKEEELKKAVKDTPLEPLAKDFILAEKTYGVSALFYCAVAVIESNWGTSQNAVDKNNLFGYKKGKSYRYFDSKELCISFVAERISTNYLTEDGIYFYGYTLTDINKKYCTNKKWDRLIYNAMLHLKDKIMKE